jgi:hypothetical protein
MQRWQMNNPQSKAEANCPGLVCFFKSDPNVIGQNCHNEPRWKNCAQLEIYPHLLSNETRVHYIGDLKTDYINGEWLIQNFDNDNLKSLPGKVEIHSSMVTYTCKKNISYEENMRTFFQVIVHLDPSLKQMKDKFFETIHSRGFALSNHLSNMSSVFSQPNASHPTNPPKKIAAYDSRNQSNDVETLSRPIMRC